MDYKRSKYSMEQILGFVFDDETGTLLVSTKDTAKNIHTGSPVESAFSKEEIQEIAKNVLERHKMTFELLAKAEKQESVCQCPPMSEQKPMQDKRARQFAKAIRKELGNCAQNSSISLLNKRMDIHSETAGKHQAVLSADMIRLDREQSKIIHQLELIEQEMKVKPVHIKETKVVERFDHRLVIFNLALLFANICLFLKIIN